MDRRTFLQTAGLSAIAAIAGCGAMPSASNGPDAVPRGSWRQAAGDAENTAQAPPVSGTDIAWRTELPDAPATPPVVSEGVAVVGTAAGTVIGIDLDAGTERWRRETSGVQGTPAISGQWVVVPGDDGRLHRFALDDGSGPAPTLIGSSLTGSVTASDGVAVLVASPGTVTAVDVDTWRVEWHTSVGLDGSATPAVVGETVLVSGRMPDGGGAVHALDSRTGDERWWAHMGDDLGPTPVATGESVFVAGAPRNSILETSREERENVVGVCWFDTETGAIARTLPAEAPLWNHCGIRSLARTDAGWTASGCNALVHYGPERATWSTTMPQGVTTRPLATPDGILVGDSHGTFWLVDGGTKNRVFDLPSLPVTPAVLDHGLVVASGKTVYGLA